MQKKVVVSGQLLFSSRLNQHLELKVTPVRFNDGVIIDKNVSKMYLYLPFSNQFLSSPAMRHEKRLNLEASSEQNPPFLLFWLIRAKSEVLNFGKQIEFSGCSENVKGC